MHRRRFLLAAASAAATAPFVGIAGCGNSSSSDGPEPVPPSDVVLSLPEDMYRHPGAPTEWWWHTGTLRAGDRTFGFEINAASFIDRHFAFTQMLLSDVQTQRVFQRTTVFPTPLFDVNTWAEADPSKNWYARLGDAANSLSAIQVVSPGGGYTSAPTIEIVGGGGSGAVAIAVLDGKGGILTIQLLSAGSGYSSPPTVNVVGGGGSGAVAQAFQTYVAMNAPASDPTQDLTVRALLIDDPSFAPIDFDLTLSQQGRPFFVWGTGQWPDGSGGVETNNFYFSLTRLDASGSIGLDGQSFEVGGVTWMDHQYGFFGSSDQPVKWFLQDMQLDNGVCISNYMTSKPVLNVQSPSLCTVQTKDGSLYYLPSFMTPIGRTWTSPRTGATYFTEFLVEIPAFRASLNVVTLVDGQEFPIPVAPLYEGIAEASGTFRGRSVAGTAWIEQAL